MNMQLLYAKYEYWSFLYYFSCTAKKRRCNSKAVDIDGSKVVLGSDKGIMNMKVFFEFLLHNICITSDYVSNKNLDYLPIMLGVTKC